LKKKSYKDAKRPQNQDPRHIVSLGASYGVIQHDSRLRLAALALSADEVHHNHENLPDDHRVKMRYCASLAAVGALSAALPYVSQNLTMRNVLRGNENGDAPH
jgi:hypothetical protein